MKHKSSRATRFGKKRVNRSPLRTLFRLHYTPSYIRNSWQISRLLLNSHLFRITGNTGSNKSVISPTHTQPLTHVALSAQYAPHSRLLIYSLFSLNSLPLLKKIWTRKPLIHIPLLKTSRYPTWDVQLTPFWANGFHLTKKKILSFRCYPIWRFVRKWKTAPKTTHHLHLHLQILKGLRPFKLNFKKTHFWKRKKKYLSTPKITKIKGRLPTKLKKRRYHLLKLNFKNVEASRFQPISKSLYASFAPIRKKFPINFTINLNRNLTLPNYAAMYTHPHSISPTTQSPISQNPQTLGFYPPYSFVQLNNFYRFVKRRFFNFFKKQKRSYAALSPLFSKIGRYVSFYSNLRKKNRNINLWPIRKWRISKIRFKPGYQRQWRVARRDIKIFLNYQVRYQHRLTWFINKIARKRNEFFRSTSGVCLLFLLIRLKFAQDIISVKRLLSYKLIFVNGTLVTNEKFILLPNDMISFPTSNYFFLSPLVNFKFRKKEYYKWFRLGNFRSFRATYQRKKIWKSSSAAYKFRQLIFFWTDTPPFYQIDWFSSSCFIFSMPLQRQFYPFLTKFDVPFSILKEYNWKYIN